MKAIKKRFPLLSVLLVLLLGLTFILRVFHFNMIQFDSDFGRDSLFGLRILTQKPTLLGAQASVGGFFLGPLYFYSIALLFAIFGPVPEIVMVWFAVLNVIAAWLGYQLLRTKVNPRAGIIFLLLFATQPLLIIASRGATHLPMLPFVTIFSLVALVRALERRRIFDHFMCACIFGLFFHIHFSALVLFPGYFIAVLLGTPGNIKHRFKILFLHGFGLLCMIAPLIAFDIRHGFMTSKAFFQYLLSSAGGASIRDTFPHWTLDRKLQEFSAYLASSRLMVILVLLGIVGGAVRLWKENKRLPNTTVVVSVLLTALAIALLIFYRGYLFPYYFVVVGTCVVVTVSICLSYFPWKNIAFVLAIIVAYTQISTLHSPYVPQFRTLDHLSRITAAIETNLESIGKPSFAIYKDSSDHLTGLGYEYRFLLTRDGYEPVDEMDYQKAQVLYVIREEGSSDPLTLGGHEMSQFSAKKKSHVADIILHERIVGIYLLTK
jgi:hypothetical protein